MNKRNFYEIYNSIKEPIDKDYIPYGKKFYNIKDLENYFNNANIQAMRVNNYLVCCNPDKPPAKIHISNIPHE